MKLIELMKFTKNEKGVSMPLFALMVPFIALVVVAAINYNFYSTGEINLDAGTDRAVDVAAINYGIDGYDDRTLLSLLDHLDGSSLDVLNRLSIYKASPDEIPGKPASGEEPLSCTQDCVIFEYNPDNESYEVVMDAWPAAVHDQCNEVIIGITAEIIHSNIAPLPFFEGPITISKIERTNVDVDCTQLGGKQVLLQAIFDSANSFGLVTDSPQTVPFVATEDSRGMSLGNGTFLVPEDGAYNIRLNLLFDNPLPTSGTLTATIAKDGTVVAETPVAFNASTPNTLTMSVTDETFAKDDTISVSLRYTGSESLQIDPDSETSTYIWITQGSQE